MTLQLQVKADSYFGQDNKFLYIKVDDYMKRKFIRNILSYFQGQIVHNF